MGQLGADDTALRELARSLASAARRLTEAGVTLDRRTRGIGGRGAGWHGVDAERFRRDWELRHRPALAEVGERCERLSRQLLAQADEQVRASASTVPAAAATPPPAAAAPAPALPPRDALPALAPTEVRYTGGVEVTAGIVTAHVTGDVVIQDLGDGRARVTVSRVGGAGLAASVGATATASISGIDHAGPPTTGMQADARLRAGLVERRTWDVDEDDVDGLLLKVGLDEGLESALRDVGPETLEAEPVVGSLVARLARAAGGIVDWTTETVGGVDLDFDGRWEDTVTIPPPSRVEHLVEVELAAGAGAALLGGAGPAAHAALNGSVRVGTAETATTTSHVFEVRGRASGSFTAALFGRLGVAGPDLRGSTDVRLELVERRDGTLDHVLVRATTTSGREMSEMLARMDLHDDGEQLAACMREVADRLRAGDLDGAAAALSTLRDPARVAGHVTIGGGTARIDGTSVRGSGSGGAGLTVGLSGRGQVLRIDRRGA